MKLMKKIGVLAAALAVILSAGMCVLAADTSADADGTAPVHTQRYRYGKLLLKHSGREYCIFADYDGDGFCDNCQRHMGHHEGKGCHGRNIAGCTAHRDADTDNICDVCGVTLLFDSSSSQPPASENTQADSGAVNGGYGTCMYADENGDGICDYCYQNSDHHAYGNCGNMGGGYCSTHGDADGDGCCDICGVEYYSADVPADPQTVDPGGNDTYGYGGYGCNSSGGGSGHHGGGHHGRGHH